MDSIKHSWNNNTLIIIETFFIDFYRPFLYGGLCLFAAFCEVSKVLLFLQITYYLLQGGYVFTRVRLLVGLSAGLHRTDFHET